MSPDEELTVAAANRVEAESRRRRIEAAHQQLADAALILQERRAALAEEETDVERLEHLSWTRVVAALRGNHATELDRVTAERDAARYAVREAEVRHQQSETELAAAQTRLDELGDTQAAYVAALAAKEEWVAVHAPGQAGRLTEIAERRGALEAEVRENQEADNAGVAAHKHLEVAAQLLSSAEAWSSWDTFMGGGLVTDMVKHGKIDDVRRELAAAESALRTFAAELADLNLETVRGLDLSFALETFDVWFDNIFSDWAVLNRIQEADGRVHQVATEVKKVVDGLRTRRRELGVELNGLSVERERLLSA